MPSLVLWQGVSMNAKVYTVAEARAIMPEVKRLMGMAQAARDEILRLRPEAWPVLRKAAGNGGSPSTNDLFQEFVKLESGIKGIMALGILVKDMDEGLVDILSERQGRKVYLCWRHGEADLLYWHELNGGFGGRQLIDEV